jgi:hypothetical protein
MHQADAHPLATEPPAPRGAPVAQADGRDRRRVSKAIGLAVPMGLLLLLQWPLRTWVEAFSSFTGNMSQILFGVYAAFAITAASRAGSHLAFVKYGAAPVSLKTQLWRAWARLFLLTPWALLMLWTATPQMVESVLHLENFKDGGFTQGYFLLRIALVLLPLLVLVHAVADVVFARRRWRLARQ